MIHDVKTSRKKTDNGAYSFWTIFSLDLSRLPSH